jgi:hypothetical protein
MASVPYGTARPLAASRMLWCPEAACSRDSVPPDDALLNILLEKVLPPETGLVVYVALFPTCRSERNCRAGLLGVGERAEI